MINLKYKKMFRESLRYYLRYFYVVVGFSLSFLLLLQLASSGLSFDIYGGDLSYLYFSSDSSIFPAILMLLIATFIQSFFSSVLVFLIRRDLQQGYYKSNVSEVVKNLFWQMLILNTVIYFFMFGAYVLFSILDIRFLLPLVYLVITIITFYASQSVIVDEKGPIYAILYSLDYVLDNKKSTALIIGVMTVLYFFLTLIVYFVPFGYLFGMIASQVFLIPILEIIKTVFYMTKIKIIDSYFN